MNVVPDTAHLVPTVHRSPYSSLSPLRPELNQSGRTILITGSSAGIGFAIARAYAEASASKIILTGRRSDVLQQAATQLSHLFPDVDVIPRVCDVGNAQESASLWSTLENDGIFVDVLVLNAARFGQQSQILLEADLDETWNLYETNVKAILDFSQRLHKQRDTEGKKKVCAQLNPCSENKEQTLTYINSISFMYRRLLSIVHLLRLLYQVTL